MSAPDGVAADDLVRYELRDSGVVVLTLNRPERMNAWGGGLASAFYSCLDRTEGDPNVRAVVVTGRGRAFCAGADMGNLSTTGNTAIGAAGDADVGKLVGERHPHFVMTLRKPIVAAINGACAGIGLTQALMCDVRFADEAAALGLVKAVVPADELLARAIGYAEDIAANCAPSSLAVIKQQVYADIMRDVFEASAVAEKLMHESMLRPDFIEGITSFFEKRPPRFPPAMSRSGEEQNALGD